MDKNSPSIYDNNLFSNHFLEERIQDTEKWQETNVEEKFDELKQLYDSKRNLLSKELNEDQTQSEFIDPVLKALGHKWVPEARTRVGSKKKGTVMNPDYTFMDMETQMEVHNNDEKSYFDVNYAVGDAKAWNRKLDKSTQDHSNPAFQIYNYVDRLRASWGILTNGKKWRLYSYEKCAADIYFEIDLENLLKGDKTEEKLEQFKYFYLLFEQEGFEQGFLQKVYQESVNFAEGLEDDLEDKVYNALEVAVEGFFETNNLDKTVENIDLVHHASLIFLYRILFILNAESRDLLPTEDKAYQQAFGLTQLKRMIVENEAEDPLFQETTVAWDNRISRLFKGIDDGYDLNETEIPAYNGGLFNEEESEENQFLARNKLYGSYIKEILELLATSYDEEKQKRIILDYKDLNIRHLGSVYEGLLEHKFKAADERKILKNSEWTDFSETNKDWEEFDEEKRVQENELYLTNESGERKATGSYYTPEYIVEYIVENTVGPKVEEKIKEAEENDSNVLTKILELNICDPAMGSGHFLTEATEYIAEHIVQHADLEKQNLDENEDELNWAKRQVVQNCIYGVDVNELAVELGKLSLWIETAARGKPLNFLDHHLKHGNSLIGSDFDQIFSHPTEDQKRLDSDRYEFGDPQEIKESFQEQYREIEEMPENTVEQIHEKEQAYKQFISNNTLYQQFNQLANIHTRQYFEKEANSSDYESFLINIGNPGNPFENTEWYKNAQSDAEDRNYFHWQLEFPKVFFGEQNGFDAVVGNPPYINVREMSNAGMDEIKDYMKEVMDTPFRNFDIYVPFFEKGINLLRPDGEIGYITPNKYVVSEYAKKLREILVEGDEDLPVKMKEITDVSEMGVFDDPSVYPHISIFERKKNFSDIREYDVEIKHNTLEDSQGFSIPIQIFKEMNKNVFPIYITEREEFIKPIVRENNKIADYAESHSGTTGYSASDTAERVFERTEAPEGDKLDFIVTKNIDPYQIEKGNLRFSKDYYEDAVLVNGEQISEGKWSLFSQSPKIIVAGMTRQVEAAIDTEGIALGVNVYAFTDLELDKNYLTACLNSKLIGFIYRTLYKAKHLRGGYLAINKSQLETVPIKDEVDLVISEKSSSLQDKNEELVNERNQFLDWLESYLECKISQLDSEESIREFYSSDFEDFFSDIKNNSNSIEPVVNSREFRETLKSEWEDSVSELNPVLNEINQLNKEIDARVFNHYNLELDEVEIALDSLDASEESKEEILEEYRKIRN